MITVKTSDPLSKHANRILDKVHTTLFTHFSFRLHAKVAERCLPASMVNIIWLASSPFPIDWKARQLNRFWTQFGKIMWTAYFKTNVLLTTSPMWWVFHFYKFSFLKFVLRRFSSLVYFGSIELKEGLFFFQLIFP